MLIRVFTSKFGSMSEANLICTLSNDRFPIPVLEFVFPGWNASTGNFNGMPWNYTNVHGTAAVMCINHYNDTLADFSDSSTILRRAHERVSCALFKHLAVFCAARHKAPIVVDCAYIFGRGLGEGCVDGLKYHPARNAIVFRTLSGDYVTEK
jgi:hypothetical protein